MIPLRRGKLTDPFAVRLAILRTVPWAWERRAVGLGRLDRPRISVPADAAVFARC